MVELIGDICQPSYLTLPEDEKFSGASILSGTIMLSGAKGMLYTGAAWQRIASTANAGHDGTFTISGGEVVTVAGGVITGVA